MTDIPISASLGRFRDGVLLAHPDAILDVLDSLDLIELARYLERTFGIRVGLADIDATNFGTLDGLITMVRQKLDSKVG